MNKLVMFLLIIIVALLIVLSITVYQLTQKQKEIVEIELKGYESKLQQYDSLLSDIKLKLAQRQKTRIVYLNKEKAKTKEDEKEYEKIGYDNLLDTLAYWINKRARASEIIEGYNNQRD